MKRSFISEVNDVKFVTHIARRATPQPLWSPLKSIDVSKLRMTGVEAITEKKLVSKYVLMFFGVILVIHSSDPNYYAYH